MPVSFGEIQSNTLVPLFHAEVTSAPQAIAPNLRMCLIGHMNKGDGFEEGIAVEDTLYILTGDDVVELFGRGSQLDAMYQRARANAPAAEIWGLAINEKEPPGSSLRAEGTITVVAAGTAKRSGGLTFWIAGRPVGIVVKDGDDIATIAAKIRAKVNILELPVRIVAAAVGGVLEVQCTWAGYTGNHIRMTHTGPHGKASMMSPEARLARQLLTFTPLSGGTQEHESASAWAAIGDEPFDIFVYPFPSVPEMDKCGEVMRDRWSPGKMLYGHAVAARIDNFDDNEAFAAPLDDPHMSILAIQQSVVPPWEWAASLAAVMVTHWAAPPELSRPLQTLLLEGMYVGAEDAASYSKDERNILLDRGMSTMTVDPDGQCRVERVRTLRKTNAYGDPDVSWADAITMFQAQYFVRSMRAFITNTFPRCALSDVPTGINGFTSPLQIRTAIMHNYKLLEGAGLVENFDLFSQFLVVERNIWDVNRVDVLMRPDFVNQLRVVAVLVETHLDLNPSALAIAA